MDQPDQLEFLDKNKNTIKLSIFENRPYQNIKKGRITYHHSRFREWKVLPYHKQTKSEKAMNITLPMSLLRAIMSSSIMNRVCKW